MHRPVPLPQAYSASSIAVSVISEVATIKPLLWRKSANARSSSISQCQHVRKAAELLLASVRYPQASSPETSWSSLTSSLHTAQKPRVSSPATATTDRASRYSTQHPPRPHLSWPRTPNTKPSASWPEQHSAKTVPGIYVELKDQGHITDGLVPYAGGRFPPITNSIAHSGDPEPQSHELIGSGKKTEQGSRIWKTVHVSQSARHVE